MQHGSDIIQTTDGSLTLKHPVHGEAYHSFAGAATEARDLYIYGSGVIDEFNAENDRDLNILDVGLGLGYNALSTIESWLLSRGKANVELVSLENTVPLIHSLISAEAEWQSNWSEQWISAVSKAQNVSPTEWRAEITHPVSGKKLLWRICHLELRTDGIPAALSGEGYDYVWQDPFSPKINPDLWTQDWFSKLAGAAGSSAVLMTYSVARPVKDSLQGAGWNYKLIPTTTAKRAWLKAELP